MHLRTGAGITGGAIDELGSGEDHHGVRGEGEFLVVVVGWAF